MKLRILNQPPADLRNQFNLSCLCTDSGRKGPRTSVVSDRPFLAPKIVVSATHFSEETGEVEHQQWKQSNNPVNISKLQPLNSVHEVQRSACTQVLHSSDSNNNSVGVQQGAIIPPPLFTDKSVNDQLYLGKHNRSFKNETTNFLNLTSSKLFRAQSLRLKSDMSALGSDGEKHYESVPERRAHWRRHSGR